MGVGVYLKAKAPLMEVQACAITGMRKCDNDTEKDQSDWHLRFQEANISTGNCSRCSWYSSTYACGQLCECACACFFQACALQACVHARACACLLACVVSVDLFSHNNKWHGIIHEIRLNLCWGTATGNIGSCDHFYNGNIEFCFVFAIRHLTLSPEVHTV